MNIYDFLPEYDSKNNNKEFWEEWHKKNDIPICKHSGHTCNKKELFRLAKEMNPFCPNICCRFCNEKLCGVRCNGAIEKILKVDIKGLMDDGYCPKCNANLIDLAVECPYCNTKLDWTEWIKLNYEFLTPAQKYYIETGKNDYWQRSH